MRLLREPQNRRSTESDSCFALDVEAAEGYALLVPKYSTGPRFRSLHSSPSHLAIKVLSVSAFLVFWVANGEFLQSISMGMSWAGVAPYNKPVFTTWFSYNFMLLSGCVAYPNIRRHHRCSFQHFLRHQWPGNLGFQRSFAGCCCITLLLQLLNILMILGLQCISVSLSNALYQLQAIFTLVLSSWVLNEKVSPGETMGMFVALLGVAFIVGPPLTMEKQDASTASCWSQAMPILSGSIGTICSAAIGGCYLVSWRIFDEYRGLSSIDKVAGFHDTQVTLFMLGFTNLCTGWVLVVLAHGTGFEIFEWPERPWFLFVNGVVEYLFDASCVIAILVTSPLMVAVASPLTIPLAMTFDYVVRGYSGDLENKVMVSLGILTVCIGVGCIEVGSRKKQHGKKSSAVL